MANTPHPRPGARHEPAVYRIASLVHGQQQSGMWDVLEITRDGLS
jgi:hypothetical protein